MKSLHKESIPDANLPGMGSSHGQFLWRYFDRWFTRIPFLLKSDVAIVIDTNELIYNITDQGVLLLGELFVSNTATFAFAMVKWYDYCEPNQ
ncbi:30041_t:CDS:2, partial [Racocetra persica]